MATVEGVEGVTVINLQEITVQCCVCGETDMGRWGVPVDDTGLIVANDYAGEWSGKPACRKCWEIHDAGGLVGHEPKF